jgi:type IV secretory pathway VirB2 component (pilin)
MAVESASGAAGARLSEFNLLRRSLTANYAFGAAVLVAALVGASDWVPPANDFWREHQAVSGLATGVVLILVAVTGLDRIFANREARRWRALALMIINKLKIRQGNVESSLYSRTLDYCQREYGNCEIPEGRNYFGVLVEALGDRRTWEPADSSGEYPDLLDELGEDLERSEKDLEVWAPLLIANSRLAEIGATAVARQNAGETVLRALALLDVWQESGMPSSVINETSMAIIVALHRYREAVDDFETIVGAYEQA